MEKLVDKQAKVSSYTVPYADYLQASKEKVYKLCQRGKIPASKFGGQWRFDKAEIDQWLRSQRPRKKR